MGFGCRVAVLMVCALGIVNVEAARAQHAWGDLSISAARIDYDLSGTGSAPAFALRTTRDLSPNVRVEVGGLFARPDQQFGSSTLFVPEVQLQYRWNVGRLAPYAGGGLGAALVKSDFHSDWDPTLSVAVGTGVRMTDAMALIGEFRLRGHEWDFVGTTSEFSVGVAWRLPVL